MYDRVAEAAYGAVSAMWNLAYDGGMGLGAAGFGVLASHTGYPGAFALTAVVLPVVLAAAGLAAGTVYAAPKHVLRSVRDDSLDLGYPGQRTTCRPVPARRGLERVDILPRLKAGDSSYYADWSSR
jgi:hypothetical protein